MLHLGRREGSSWLRMSHKHHSVDRSRVHHLMFDWRLWKLIACSGMAFVQHFDNFRISLTCGCDEIDCEWLEMK